MAAQLLIRELGSTLSQYTFIDFCAGAGGPTPSIEREVNGHLRSKNEKVCSEDSLSMKANIELDIGRKTFASGLLPELISVLRRSRPGDLVALIGEDESIGPELETWCRFTGSPLLATTVEKGRPRWVFRCGPGTLPAEDRRPVGSRLWLY